MRAARYINALEQWLCIDCVGAVLDKILTLEQIWEIKEQRPGDQAEGLREMMRERRVV
jgi:hypothetical protein